MNSVPVLSDVTVKYHTLTHPVTFEERYVATRGPDVLCLVSPDDPEDYVLIPLTSGNVRYVNVSRSGIDE